MSKPMMILSVVAIVPKKGDVTFDHPIIHYCDGVKQTEIRAPMFIAGFSRDEAKEELCRLVDKMCDQWKEDNS